MTYLFRAAHCALALIVLTLGVIYARPAAAQDFSDKPIRIIVGLAPGGATDVTARLIALRLTQSLNTNVYVENKPGGAFEPAYHELASAAPDGHTLFMISAAVTVTQPAQKDYPYDIRKMTPVTEVSEGPFILVGRKALNFRNVTDLVDYGKKNPGKLTFGSGGGTGSSLSLAAELLHISAGISIVNVPYKGAAEALNDLLGGRVDAMFDAMPVQVGQVKAGNVSGLAVTSAQRASALPDVPTMVESGFKDYVVSNYFGLLAPPDTPPAVTKKLRDEVAKIVAAQDVAELFDKQGMKPVAGEPAQFGNVLSADLARWSDVIKKAGIQVQ
ncbi:MAG: tripartite tricarboxylate transporter substrate binding protein [Xanthobacteraceae bacterium]